MRKLFIATALSVGFGVLSFPSQSFNFRSYLEFRQVATEREHEGKWLQIHWLKDMNQAKAKAKAENKPILVFLVIGFHGQKNASDC